MGSYNKSSNYFVYLAAAAANLYSFSAGICLSWSSPVLPKLSSTDPSINPLPRPITLSEESWIASIMYLGTVFGPLAAGICSKRFGKKKTLLMWGASMVLSHLICGFAVNVYLFLVARFLIGIGVGIAFAVVPAYVVDIAEDDSRGIVGCFLGVFSCAGILYSYCLGPFLSVKAFSFVNLIPISTFYVLFGYFIPESPYDLVRLGNQNAAEESLIILRNKASGDVKKELVSIIEGIEDTGSQNTNGCFSIFKSRALTKGLIIANGLMLFQQLSGINAVFGYLQSIFESAGSSIPSIYSAMLVGFIQLLSNIASANLVERAGRKSLLTISFVFQTLSLVALGAFFFLKSSGKNVDAISWLPVASLVVFIVSYNLGMANMPWVVLGELFPTNMKATASTITSFFVLFVSFLVTMGFPYLNVAIGMASTFWMFAVFLVIGFVFLLIMVPETRGKTNLEIQNMLEEIK